VRSCIDQGRSSPICIRPSVAGGGGVFDSTGRSGTPASFFVV